MNWANLPHCISSCSTFFTNIHERSVSFLLLFSPSFPRSRPPAMHSRDKHKTKTQQTEPKTLIFLVEGECTTPIFLSHSWSSHFPYFPLTSSLSRWGWMEESGGERRRQERKREGVDVLCSSAECAHMYERRRSIYFRTLAWVYTNLKHTRTHAGTHTHTHTHTLGKWDLTSPEISLTYLYINLVFESCWKDAFLSGSKTFPYTWIL